MKKLLSLLLCAALLTGCGNTAPETTEADTPAASVPAAAQTGADYVSRFDHETTITLSDDGILTDAPDGGSDSVHVTHDIIYYEDRDTYESGNPYGEGTDADKHTTEEASAHTVVTITKPGAYRVGGKLSSGQIRVDLGEDAYENPDAVVELILHDADITCTVAPAILFLNTYECDGNWSAETAKPDVDTSAAGASLILEGSNTVNGSYVAKIFKDQEGEKKLWKQDGAIYSYTSLNVFGPGSLELNAANEGLDTELHLTINGGNITIHSDNDGINTNEDGVSVTTINGGHLSIAAGLGMEGDGIDSNGYLVINGGTVIAAANPAADAGMDSDLGSYIHGGTVIALGSTMDWAESDSMQAAMNLQFAGSQAPGSELTVVSLDGTEILSHIPSRSYTGAILSTPELHQGESYHVFVDGTQMAYTGNDVGRFHPGGMDGGFGGRGPGGMQPGQMPEGVNPGEPPEGFDPGQMGTPPENGMPPEGILPPNLPDGGIPPEGDPPERPQNGSGGRDPMQSGSSPETHTEFYMNDMVNSFSGVSAAA